MRLPFALWTKFEIHQDRDLVAAFEERGRLEAEELEVREAREEAGHGVAAPALLEPFEGFAAPVVLPRHVGRQSREDRRDIALAERFVDRFHRIGIARHGSSSFSIGRMWSDPAEARHGPQGIEWVAPAWLPKRGTRRRY